MHKIKDMMVDAAVQIDKQGLELSKNILMMRRSGS